MNIVINDTNIFLDLFEVGLLDAFFSLPYQFHTVDFVIAEVTRADEQKAIRKFIENGKLFVKEYNARQFRSLFQFKNTCGGNLTLTDSTVIFYAQSIKRCRLLTGDRQLRKKAEERGLLVSGILYVFELLVKRKAIPPKQAAAKLRKLFAINPRLPRHEVESYIAKWSK